MLLKCIAETKSKKEEGKKEDGDDLMKPKKEKKGKKGAEDEDDEESGSGSRSNHQRLQAVELLGYLIKECQGSEASREKLAKNLHILSSVIIRSVQTADSWKNKKVSKTIQVVNLYIKAARILVHKQAESVEEVRKQGVLVVKALEAECEKDKTMSNLKGKIKEIQAIIKGA